VAAAVNELHSAGKELSLIHLKSVLRAQTEESAQRSGNAIVLSRLPVQGPTQRYLDAFIDRHEMVVKAGDMRNTVNRNERMSCPRGCFASFILVYAYHGYSPAWTIFTEDAMTCVFAPVRSGNKVCRLVDESEFEQYMQLVSHIEVDGVFNAAGYPVDANGIVMCNLKLHSHPRHSEQSLHLPFAIKTLWVYNGSGDNGPCTFCIAIPSMLDGEFHFEEVVGLLWTGDSAAKGHVYFSKTRSTSQVAEHWKLNVRNGFVAKSNLVNKILEKKV